MSRLLLASAVLLALTLPGPASSQLPSGSGALRVVPAAPSSCLGEGHFFPGQAVRVSGSGFNPNAAVQVYLTIENGSRTLISTTSANSSGVLNAVTTLPPALSTPGMALLEAEGAQGTDGLLNLSALFTLLASGGADSDGDGVPDACDNCPNNPNPAQEDGDSDGVGNVCDACPSDQQNDSDGDSICGDVDACPSDANNDADGDQVCGNVDNCPNVANANQLDADANGIGDACQTNATCADGIDNDGDGQIDHPSDPGCSSATDTAETDPALPCDDGIDNDADGLIDFKSGGGGLSDPGCASATLLAENPQCDDSVDNDGDGKVDWDGNFNEFPADPDCGGVGSNVSELPEPGFTVGLASGVCLLVALSRGRHG